ncbi:MAG TPA: hypothetical protein VN803_13460 [Gemmatimonadales bacterium]|nr:hypothetical protein [Gemmatimonadales bacterium]
MTNAVSGAVASWNTVFNQPHLPVLTQTGPLVDPMITVQYDLTLGGTSYCGKWEQSERTIKVRSTSSGTCPFGSSFNLVTDPSGLVKHEMSHAAGFLQHLSEIGGAPVAGCLASVPTGGFNQEICTHEPQVVWYMYGIRNTDPLLTQQMYSPTVTLSPSSATIYTGASQTFTTSILVDGGSVTPTLTWITPSPAIASYTSTSDASATVQAGQTEGQTQVAAQINEDRTFVWPPFTGSATLTIQKPPITSITIAPSSVTLSGIDDTTLIATVIDATGAVRTDVTLTWIVNNTVVWSVPYAQSVWISAKKNGTITIRAVAPNGVEGTVTVTVTNCPVQCAA